MAMHYFFFVTFVLSFLNFTAAAPDSGLRILHRRDVCTQDGQVDCYSNCMPPQAVCCSDGSGTYCPPVEYCVPNGCCPNGETCTGGGGTTTKTTLTGTGSSPTQIPTSTTGASSSSTTPTGRTPSTDYVPTGNALSPLSHSLERFAFLLVVAGQWLLGWCIDRLHS